MSFRSQKNTKQKITKINIKVSKPFSNLQLFNEFPMTLNNLGIPSAWSEKSNRKNNPVLTLIHRKGQIIL